MIDPSNWLSAPNNRTAFRQVADIFPHTTLQPNPASTASDLPRSAAFSNSGILEAKYKQHELMGGEERTFRQMLTSTYTDAFIVMQGGAVVAEVYENGMQAGDKHLMNSVTKTFVGMLCGILAGEGVLDTSKLLVHYIPELSDSAFKGTTVQQALDMTGAVAYTEDYNSPFDTFWQETAVVGWRPDLPKTAKDLLDFAVQLKDVESADGEKFHYRTVLTNLAAMACERAAGKGTAALLEEKIWQRLRPEGDAAIVKDASGFPYVGAGMNARALDLARFGLMLGAQGRNKDGEQVVPEEWLRSTMAGDDTLRAQFAASDYALLFGPNAHYTNFTWCMPDSGMLVCLGIFGQLIHINLETDSVIVKFSSQPGPAEGELFFDMIHACGELSKMLHGGTIGPATSKL